MKKEIDPEIFDLIPEFLNRRHKDVIELKEYHQKEKYTELKRVAHNLKGVGSAFGFDEITDYGNKIEALLQNENYGGVNDVINDFELYLNVVEPVEKFY